mgnify:CR=1 FL=1
MQRVRTSKQWFAVIAAGLALAGAVAVAAPKAGRDRKSTRLNSSHT